MAFGNHEIDPPLRLETPQFLLRPLAPSDAELDHEAVMESRVFLRIWEQDTWPTDDFTVEENRGDLQRHHDEFTSGLAFTYTVMNPDETECLGCVYIYPPSAKWIARDDKESLDGSDWNEVEACVYFWIRESRLAEGMDADLLAVLRTWLAAQWPTINRGPTNQGPINHVFVTHEDLHQQMEMIEAAGLTRRHAIGDAEASGRYLSFS